MIRIRACLPAGRSWWTIRIRACLQACRKRRNSKAPSGAGFWLPASSSRKLHDDLGGAIGGMLARSGSSRGVGLTFENALIGIGGSAFSGVFQEFFSRKLTPHAPDPPATRN